MVRRPGDETAAVSRAGRADRRRRTGPGGGTHAVAHHASDRTPATVVWRRIRRAGTLTSHILPEKCRMQEGYLSAGCRRASECNGTIKPPIPASAAPCSRADNNRSRRFVDGLRGKLAVLPCPKGVLESSARGGVPRRGALAAPDGRDRTGRDPGCRRRRRIDLFDDATVPAPVATVEPTLIVVRDAVSDSPDHRARSSLRLRDLPSAHRSSRSHWCHCRENE